MTFEMWTSIDIYSGRVSIPGTQVLSSPNNGSLVCTVTWESLSESKLSVHTNQFITFTLRKEADIINLPISHQLGTLMNGLRLLWQLPCVLFRTHRTCCYCINQNTVFQGKSVILGTMPSHLDTSISTLSMYQSAAFSEASVPRPCTWAMALASWFPGGVSALWTQKTVRTGSGSCRWAQMPFHISWLHRTYPQSSILHLPIVQAIGLISLEQPISVERVKDQKSWVITWQSA